MSSVYRSLSKKQKTTHTPDATSSETKGVRQRLLALTSRGVTYRHRHLLQDINSLLPHSRKDAKLDTKSQLSQLNELADLYNCNNIMFFEARKAKDLYIWLSKPPNGPTVKFHCQNVHTMEELNFTGNCLRGSRPILSFDKTFDGQAHTRLIKELLTHVFGVPQSSRRVKPFVDHVMGFTVADGKIWIRCYQISETEASKTGSKPTDQENEAPAASTVTAAKEGRGETSISLVEIGPRFVLTPIVILEGSFGGPVIYENKEFVSPNQIRSDLRRTKAGRYNTRAEGTLERKVKKRDLGLRTGEGRREVDELDERVLFA
ncbi:Ribosome biogenesis protein brx1 [Friedmanniomyces endolithicus]|uniref:Ribosome biogenesis protein brx1 n=1 Tax=Friedmanniomyces endolithicus TaxID=329885 RepID=A0A4U0VD94_9PEZI|nr:Ribosome biogenesis protein brx1 [Friedmanniomyces endolithicus]KAK0364182.1 Ribosome biogenesis protein brx1 [Friedmanniomyces endolithicus]KAK0776798.1 Ribosome biogenesis protein brx1 [Friedmanniomyces endolithicus]KAK0790649.1 Ribosome biogenesis protein brx1 [Friedmanniomyces endolithicus]KAK0795284.1 Ribosome biogenesis protein brx1 [Friedmanniomyces endolithicus]